MCWASIARRICSPRNGSLRGRDTPACGWSTPGSDPVVIHTPLASIGLSVCYDGDFPELFRAMAIMGAEVICRPTMLTRSFEIWELTNRAL